MITFTKSRKRTTSYSDDVVHSTPIQSMRLPKKPRFSNSLSTSSMKIYTGENEPSVDGKLKHNLSIEITLKPSRRRSLGECISSTKRKIQEKIKKSSKDESNTGQLHLIKRLLARDEKVIEDLVIWEEKFSYDHDDE